MESIDLPRVHQKRPLVRVLSQMVAVHIFTSSPFNVHFNIILLAKLGIRTGLCLWRSPPAVLRISPISSFIWSLYWYQVSGKKYESPHCVLFSTPAVLLPLYEIELPVSVLCSQIFSIFNWLVGYLIPVFRLYKLYTVEWQDDCER